MNEDNENYSDEDSCEESTEKYLEQNIKENDSNSEDFDWKPTTERKKSNKSKSTTNSTPVRRKHIIYNPPERSVNYRNVTIGNKVYDCQIGDDDMFHCEFGDCSRVFAQKGNLIRHYAVHGAEKQYKCHYPECDREFADKSAFNRHLIVHSGAKPYECDWPSCGYRCNGITL